jgi:hypothetical protein
MTAAFAHRSPSCLLALRAAAAAIALTLAACGPSPSPPSAAPAADGWHEFSGSWNASGTRRMLSLGGDRHAALVDLSGSMFLAGPSRPGVGFRAEGIALVDTATGLVGRSVWTDDRGDQVYSEIRGEGPATGKRLTGTFIGGTGRYAGATGSYEFVWQYVLYADEGTIQGRATDLVGRVRVGAAAAKP